MSNEEVVLKMLVNRLEQMLELIPELKTKWEHEITEIIHLGKGVIVETPEPPAGRPDPTLAGAYEQDLNGSWHLPLDEDMVQLLYNTNFVWNDRHVRNELGERVNTLYSTVYPEPDGDDDYDPDDNPDPIQDEPVPQPLEGVVPDHTRLIWRDLDLGLPVAPQPMPYPARIQALRDALQGYPIRFGQPEPQEGPTMAGLNDALADDQAHGPEPEQHHGQE
jgi:hypothetical protein